MPRRRCSVPIWSCPRSCASCSARLTTMRAPSLNRSSTTPLLPLGVRRGKLGDRARGGPDMKVKDVMTVDPITVGPDLPFKEVVDRLIEHAIGGLPVVDAEGGLIGIVTETDLLTKEACGAE